jgi:Tol biopolymer transport system component
LAALALLAAAGIGVVASRRPREEPPVYRQLTFRRGGVAGARFTPDGHTIVYSADWDGKPFQLFSTRTDSTESTPMPLPSADILSISSAGQMALGLLKPDFGHQILAEVSLAGGAPREILESEVDGVDEGFADWAPDGKSLAVARRVAGRSRLEWPIGKVLYESPDTFLRLPRFSPDGKSIAFVEAGAGQIPEQSIGLLETSGRKSTLSHGWNSIFGLNWNPKTSEIWFSGRESARGRGGLALHAVSPSGRHRVVARGPDSLVLKDIFRDGRVLLEHSQYSTTIAWLPPGGPKEIDLSWLQFSDLADLSEDGGTILFGEFVSGEGSAGGVYVRKTDGSAAVRLGEGVPAALSPDGKWVVSISSMGDRLQLLRTGAGESRDLSSKGMRYRDAKWFPDGRRIVLSARVEGRPPRLYVQDVTGGSPTPLTPEGFEIGPVSPDGKLVAARDPEGKVVLYPVAGGAPQVVPGLDSGDRVIRWDAKGEALFLGRGLLPARIDRFRLSSGKREALWQIEPGDRSGVGGIGNVFVTPDGRSYAYSYMRDLDCLYLVDGLH